MSYFNNISYYVKDELFELVNSLSQNEKRYFKRYATLHSEKQDKTYVQLFNALDAQQKKTTHEEFENHKHLAQLRRQLQIKIMESLRAFHAKDAIEFKLQLLLQDFELLFQKSLYKQARRVIHKAKKLATSYSKQTDIIKIYKLEARLLKAENNLQALKANLEQMPKILETAVETIKHETALEQVYTAMLRWNSEVEFIRNDSELQELNRLMGSNELKSEPVSTNSRIKYRYINGLYYFLKGEFNTSYGFFARHLLLLEANPEIIRENPDIHIRSISNFILLSLKLHNFENFSSGLQKLQHLKTTSERTSAFICYRIYMFKLMYYSNTGQFNEAKNIIDQNWITIQPIDLQITQEKILPIEQLYLKLSTVQTYIGLGDYRTALRHANEFVHNPNLSLKQDAHTIVQLIVMLLHFERENDDILASNLRHTHQLLIKKGRLFQFENAFLQFLKKAIYTHRDNELKSHFIELRKTLITLKNDPLERSAFEFFDFISWLNSKIDAELFSKHVSFPFKNSQLPVLK